MDNIFNGFAPPTKNYFHMPNEWVNISAKITNLAELKVIEYVLRHTWGYHEYDGKPKPITTDEFMHGRKRADGTRMDDGTGLSNKSVVEGLKRAIEHGYLICVVDDTDKARISKSYALKMNHPDSNRYVESTHQSDVKNLHSGVKNLHSDYVRSSHRSEKDTLEKHSRKKECKPTVPVTEPESLTHSSTPSSLSSSQEKQETPSPKEEKPSSEIARVKGYWKQLGYREEKSAAWAELAEKTKTFDDFKSLFDFAAEQLRKDTKITNKEVHPGNMLNFLNGWKQEQARLAQPSQPKPPQRMSLAERNRMLEEKYGKPSVAGRK